MLGCGVGCLVSKLELLSRRVSSVGGAGPDPPASALNASPPSVYTLLAIETADCCADCAADLTGDLSPAAVLWLQPMISAAIERRDRPACVVTCGRLLPTLSAELHSPAEERCERRRVGTT